MSEQTSVGAIVKFHSNKDAYESRLFDCVGIVFLEMENTDVKGNKNVWWILTPQGQRVPIAKNYCKEVIYDHTNSDHARLFALLEEYKKSTDINCL